MCGARRLRCVRDETHPGPRSAAAPSASGDTRPTTAARPTVGSALPGAAALRWEIACLLALSLGASAVSAVISFAGVLTAPESLAEHTASLVRPQADRRPWLDLSWQLYRVAVGLAPVLLAGYLLHRSAESMRTIGFDLRRPWFDLRSGAVLAALIGTGGLAVYVVSWQLGMTVTIAPSALEGNWWDVPVLVLQAAKNGILEEVIVVGYLLHRLGQLGWAPWKAVAAASVLRALYHLYQGVGMFFGNLVMGLVFGWFYHRYGRVMPLAVAHTVIDIAAFVGSVYLLDRLSWLPS